MASATTHHAYGSERIMNYFCTLYGGHCVLDATHSEWRVRQNTVDIYLGQRSLHVFGAYILILALVVYNIRYVYQTNVDVQSTFLSAFILLKIEVVFADMKQRTL